MNPQNLKQQITAFVEAQKDLLDAFNLDIFEHPELSMAEYHACEQYERILGQFGIPLTRPYAGLETAFRADFQGEKGSGPHVAIMAEYDALPEIGHGCGHNMSATAGLGAFLALYSIKSELCGTVSLIGTPAEEKYGGKILMLKNGGFDGLDCTMMIHSTSSKPYIARPARACGHVVITFHGKPAHSANPRNGIDALSAGRALFMLLDIMRPRLPGGANVNGIVTEAGTRSNIICDKSVLEFSTRGTTVSDLKKILEVLEHCAEAADLVIGTTHETVAEPLYAERYSNMPMDEAFAANAETLGLTMQLPPQGQNWGSSDSGNVSIAVPTIHEYIPAVNRTPDTSNIPAHTKEYAAICCSETALSNSRLAAKAMAMTVVDILASPDLQAQIKKYYLEQIPAEYQKAAGNWKQLFG